jgi:hypothetical protein
MARSATFKWASLDKYSIIEMLKPCRSLVVNQKLTVFQVKQLFSKHLKAYLPVKVATDKDFNTEPGLVYIGGYYEAALDKYKLQCITILLSFNPLDSHVIISSKRFKAMCNTIADTILHEIIHMRQARARNFKSIPGFSSYAESNKQRKQQNYLGDPDEIDAYGFNIACDLQGRFGTQSAIAKHLNKDMTDKRLKKDTWYTYLQAFDHNHRHPVIQKLKKRIVYYVPYAELGKPYKTTNWLSK